MQARYFTTFYAYFLKKKGLNSLCQIIQMRRTFHQFPELSDKEYETTKRLKRILESFDITILDVPLETGLVAEIGRGEPVIAVRTDIDALPIN